MTDTQRTVTLREARRLASFNEPVLIEQDTLRELLRLATPPSEEATDYPCIHCGTPLAVCSLDRPCCDDSDHPYATAREVIAELNADLNLESRTPPSEEATGLREVIDAAWGGYERPGTDAGILNAIADWMDRLDDVADKLARRPVVHRTMQADLRRIAATPPSEEATDRTRGMRKGLHGYDRRDEPVYPDEATPPSEEATGPDLLALQYPWPIEFGSREAAGWNRAFETMRAALATPPSEKATRPNLAPTRDDVEWLIWYARKVKGTVTEVAQRALDENPGLRPGGWATPPSEEATGLREALERIAALGPKGPFLMVTDELREAQDIARAALAKGSE
jgi:hypothetical protein